MQEKVAETHRYVRGMPASAATSPETAVPETSLQPLAPEAPSAKDAEESKGLVIQQEMERRRAGDGAHR